MAGDWTATDLAGLLTVFAAPARRLVPPLAAADATAGRRASRRTTSSTIEGARRNIDRHYDLSNEPVRAVPRRDDDLLVGPVPSRDGTPCGDLADAQRRKIDRLLDLARVGPGCRVLEIGTGWGELAIRAARRGASVTTVTISREQQALAARRVAAAGLGRPGRVELRDYRDVDGRYDAIVLGRDARGGRRARTGRPTSRPATGPARPGGPVGLQTITMPHDRMLATRRHLHLDAEVHLPGRPASRRSGDRGQPGAHTALRIAGRERLRRALRRDAADLAGALRRAGRRGRQRSASTRRSAGCGSSTWPTPRPASAPGTSTSSSSPWPGAAMSTAQGRRRGHRRAARPRRARPAGPAARLGRQRGRCPRTAPVLVARSPRALRRLLWRPGELGLARAYVTGDLDVEGDLTEGLRRVRAARGRPGRGRTPVALAAIQGVARLGLLAPPPEPPACEAQGRAAAGTAGPGTRR